MNSSNSGAAPGSEYTVTPMAVDWLFQHALDPLFLARPDGTILRANDAATRMLRMTEKQIQAGGRAALVVPNQDLRDILKNRHETGSARGKLRMRRGDGTEFVAEVTTAVLPIANDELSYVMLRDLTEQERNAQALRESEERYAAIFEKTPVPIVLAKLPEGIIVHANPAFLRVFECEAHEIVGKTSPVLGLASVAERAELQEVFRRQGFVRNMKVSRRSRSGEPRTLSVTIESISVAGEPYLLAMALDMTTQVVAEEAIRANEEKLSLFVKQAPTSIAIFDREMNYLAHSRRFLADFGLPEQCLVGRSHYDVFPGLPQAIIDVHRRCLTGASERSDETPLAPPNGQVEWYRWEMVPWLDPQGEIGGVALFSERITELKNAREKIANQERLLANVIDGSPSFIKALDHDGRIMFANEASARLLGKTKAEIVGTHASTILPPDRINWVMRRHAEVMATGEPQTLETTLATDNGPISVIATRYPLRDTTGHIYGTASVMTDITSQKRIEDELRCSEQRTRDALEALEKALEVTRRTEEKLRQMQKMEAIGRLAGGVAHDFNNLLTVILGNSSEVLASLSPADPLREVMSEIEKAGQRAAALTRQLLVFSRKQILEPRIANINDVITGAEKMLRRIVGEDIELTLLLDSQPQWCKVDKGQFEQVLLNLVVNARDAMIDGGRLTIETTTLFLDAHYAAEHPEIKIGDYVRVVVSDTGIGIPKDVQPHVFEPFFTTKGVGQGTGLGLSTVYGIIRQSGGMIWLYSEPGQGTSFRIYLPRQNQGIGDSVAQTASISTTRGKEVVLLVEDDEQVRNTIAGILRRAGYHVISAANGGEALLICEDHPGTIHLLLTDVVMPKLNGRKLAERLRQIRPQMRVVFMSGYTQNVVLHHGMLDPHLDFLAKPITGDILLTKVREVLDR